MLRTLFLILWVSLYFGPPAQAVEIYADGHKFDSFQAYLAFKKSALEQPAAPTPAALNSQQEDYIRKEAEQAGVIVDFSKVKTFQINQKRLSARALHKLYVLSVEHGMVGALQDFYQRWGQPDFPAALDISSQQLQQVIRQEVTVSQAPKLLISGPGKVRIMALTARDEPK